MRFSVQGLRERLARKRERRLHQNRGLRDWVAADADPHAAGGYSMNPKYDVNVKDGVLVFVRSAETYADEQRAQALFWADGEIISRFAFDIDREYMPQFDIDVRSATGPTGSTTLYPRGDTSPRPGVDLQTRRPKVVQAMIPPRS